MMKKVLEQNIDDATRNFIKKGLNDKSPLPVDHYENLLIICGRPGGTKSMFRDVEKEFAFLETEYYTK